VLFDMGLQGLLTKCASVLKAKISKALKGKEKFSHDLYGWSQFAQPNTWHLKIYMILPKADIQEV